MRRALLGIKIIGGFFIISSIWNCLTQMTVQRYALALVLLLINFIIGINLLRKREFARKLAIFIAFFSLISFVILMFVVPITGMQVRKNYEARQISYEDLTVHLDKLKNGEGPKAEIANIKEKLARLKRYIEWYPNFQKSIDRMNENFNVLTGILYICFFGMIIYYLKKSYVRKQFGEK